MSNIQLPENQNSLLKEMQEIDAQEKSGIIPIRNNLNLILIFTTWGLGILMSILSIVTKTPEDLNFIIIACLSLTGVFALAYYNIKAGFYLVCIVAVLVDIISIWTFPELTNEFRILFGGIAVFSLANQFYYQGYFVGIVIVYANLIVFRLINQFVNIESMIAELLIISTIGFIPILTLSISRVSRIAKKQEIRAEILSLQNQELISNWGETLRPQTKTETFKVNQELPETTSESSVYQSAYSPDLKTKV